jgi:hypothetical protein
MAMEHRWGTRQLAAGLHVVIDCPSLGLIQGEIRDISTSGVYVRTPLKPRVDARVKLAIVLRDTHVPHIVPAWAIVVRADRDGVGMMFESCDARGLAELLERVSTPALGSATGKPARVPAAWRTSPARHHGTSLPHRERNKSSA